MKTCVMGLTLLFFGSILFAISFMVAQLPGRGLDPQHHWRHGGGAYGR
jgi:hypothetical protein